MSKKIDLSEPIKKVSERLLRQHSDLLAELDAIDDECKKNPLKAVEMLKNIKSAILQHSVEEEARLIRIIMQKAKSESAESVKVMQEHRWVVDFLERKLDSLVTLNSSQIKNEVMQFSEQLRKHFSEEENVVFPLVSRLTDES